MYRPFDKCRSGRPPPRPLVTTLLDNSYLGGGEVDIKEDVGRVISTKHRFIQQGYGIRSHVITNIISIIIIIISSSSSSSPTAL